MVGGPEDAADKQALQKLYDDNKDKANEGYTDGSWAAFQKALADAKTVLDNPDATQAEVDNAAKALTDAISGLTKAEPQTADKSKLQRLYDSVKNKSNDGFTSASWKTFEKALKNAKAVLDNPDATQKTVDDAYSRLLSAIVQLEKTGSTPVDGYFVIVALANEGGSISPSGRIDVKAGSDKSFTVTADKGYRVQKVLVDGKEVRLEKGRYTFEDIAASHSIEAFFTKDKSNVDTGAGSGAEMSLSLGGAALLLAALLPKRKKF